MSLHLRFLSSSSVAVPLRNSLQLNGIERFRRLKFSSCCIRFYSDKKPTSSSFSTSIEPSRGTTFYRVNKISPDGTSECCSLTVADIIRGSSVHVRDLFSLNLTSFDEEQADEEFEISSYRTDKEARRKIISQNPQPVILPRGNKVIVCFGHIKALIEKNEGMLFAAHQPNIQLFSEELSNILKERFQFFSHDPSTKNVDANDPFEILFLEQILFSVSATWSRRILLYKPIIDELSVRAMGTDAYNVQSGVNIQRLSVLKDSLQNFEMQVSQALDCLTTLLNDDDDMVNLLLTAKAAAEEKGTDMDVEMHESVELIFEEYSRQLSTLLQEINYLLKRVEGKQDLLKMSLDTYRNQMLQLNVYLSVGAMSLASATTVAGFFGMNLVHGFEESQNAFAVTVASTTCLSGLVFLACIRNLTPNPRIAVSQFEEINTIKKALSDLNSVDYATKVLMSSESEMDMDTFKTILNKARTDGREVSEKEASFLFDILDTSKDGRLQNEEMINLRTELELERRKD